MAGFGLHLGAYYCQWGFWVRELTCSGKGLMAGGDTPDSCIPVFFGGGGEQEERPYLNRPGPEALSVDVPLFHAAAPADNALIVYSPLEESARETSGCL